MHLARLSLLFSILATTGCAWMPDFLRPSSSLPPVTTTDEVRGERSADAVAPSLRHGRYVLAPAHARQQVQVETAYNWMPGEVFDKIGGFDVLPEISPRAAETIPHTESHDVTPPDRIQVYFSTGSAELTAAALNRLEGLPPGQYRVLGFADPRGSHERNLELSRQRAGAVVRWLAQHSYSVTAVDACGVVLVTQNPNVFARERRVDILSDPQGKAAGCPAP